MHIDAAFLTLALLVALALAFDFMNGFHDAANSIATVVSTRVLKPYQAVIFAALFNFVAIWLFETKVAATVGKGIIEPAFVDNALIFGALIGAIVWNVVTWYFGIPSSSSHALIGGMIGAAMAKAGLAPLMAPGIIRTTAFILVAPLLGMAIGAALMLLISWTCFRMAPRKLDRWFRRSQLVASALYSIGHGSNDAQKTMGIIWLLLMSQGLATPAHLPGWVIVSCYLAISVGTLFGGWRIIRTMGSGLTDVKPAQGFAAEVSTASAILTSSHLGFALSTTQVASGSVIGSGLGRKGAEVRWGTAGRIALGWLFTLPAAAIIGGLAAWLTHTGAVGVGIVAVLGVGMLLLFWYLSRKNHVGHEDTLSDIDNSGAAVNIVSKKERRERAKADAKAARKAAQEAMDKEPDNS
jgi:PiT family inorganic phosphate transporter